MIKLSELPNDTMLWIEWSNFNYEVTDKEDYLQMCEFDPDYASGTSIYLAEYHTAYFSAVDIEYMIENNSDDQYEDWDQDISGYIGLYESGSEVEAFLNFMNDVAAKHPSYHKGEQVEVDLEVQ